MIVKFFKRGRGSCKATMDYMLGKNRDREHSRILQGDPELTRRIADNLEFKNRYTAGVLSFEEKNLSELDKHKIMADFENCIFSGLEHDGYSITWIEHTDKDRLELNFVIANVELNSGKRLQPYFDRIDRPMVENWKQCINHEYGLSDPNDPARQQVKKGPSNAPERVQAIKDAIGEVITSQIAKHAITSRSDVLDALQRAGFEIARVTDKSISIKNPDGKRNIRLEGSIYENRRFGQEFAAERATARRDHDSTATERYSTAYRKLQRAIAVKFEHNKANFGEAAEIYRRPQMGIHGTRGIRQPHFDNAAHIRHPDMADKEPVQGTTGSQNRTGAIAVTSQSVSQDRYNRPGRQNLHRKQEPQGQDLAEQRQAANHGAAIVWTEQDLLERGLTPKQAAYCVKEQRKAFNPLWSEDAQQRQLERIQERLNSAIANHTLDQEIKGKGLGR